MGNQCEYDGSYRQLPIEMNSAFQLPSKYVLAMTSNRPG